MESIKSGKKRNNIKIGSLVEVVEKHHQRTGELTEGFVKRILTNSKTHPHGIKVMLQTGEVGRVKNIIDDGEDDDF
ncbi:MAG: YwbE family protein [Saprospiraceae bacterium]